jgi:ADP-heptose:LPS heptosyltransferase
VSRGNAARDERRYDAAAALYEEALRLVPDHSGIRVQCGHMYKETGNFALAEMQYREAERLTPDDPDLALQLGHLHKVAGRPLEARDAYAKAERLNPGWQVALREQRRMDEILSKTNLVPADITFAELDSDRQASAFVGITARNVARLVPSLAPRRRDDLLLEHREEISLRRIGRPEMGFWGNRPTLRGIEAIRGFCASETPIVAVDLLLNGFRIHRGSIRGGYPFKRERDMERIKKYVFNLWIDFSPFVRGKHELEVQLIDANEARRSVVQEVVIADAEREIDWPDSDFLIDSDPSDLRPLDEQIRLRPSMVRQARRTLFPDGVKNVLVMRMDQLGDVVASVPALFRLRELLPEARLVGMFTAANADLARTLGVLDEIIVVDFPDDRLEQRRVMPLKTQEELRARLESYAFDIAIDLAQSGASRPLLWLANAKFTHATGGDEWPWLSSEFSFNTHDRWTRHDRTPHSTKVMALVEALGSLLKTQAPILQRSDLSRDLLGHYGISAGEPYAVIHTGARIGFSQWPHYDGLVAALMERTNLKLVMINDDPMMRASISQKLLADPRLHIVDGKLPFDDFDALVSFATVIVGNDSGPKHLASLRGTPVVTLFSARINWTEWGQENVGTIISRKVPCAGCAILHDAEECGRDFACIRDIQVEEVFQAVKGYIGAETASECA